jgi:hypothetical protein
MNLLSLPYNGMGTLFGPASILVLIGGLACSWRYGVRGTAVQHAVIFCLSTCLGTLFNSSHDALFQKLAGGAIMGVMLSIAMVPFNIAGLIGWYYTRKRRG